MVQWRSLVESWLTASVITETSPFATSTATSEALVPNADPFVLNLAAAAVPAVLSSTPPPDVPAGYTETLQVLPPVPLPSQPSPPPACTVTLGTHDFAFSYGHPWVANYTPPIDCVGPWGSVVMEWEAYVTGVQFDRVIQVFVGGAEIYRGITDEPSRNGIWWKVEKDVTDKSFIFGEAQTVVVGLDNVV
ncbi:hypothetical protein HK101_006337, partial [Irineochytrium annulatum]